MAGFCHLDDAAVALWSTDLLLDFTPGSFTFIDADKAPQVMRFVGPVWIDENAGIPTGTE